MRLIEQPLQVGDRSPPRQVGLEVRGLLGSEGQLLAQDLGEGGRERRPALDALLNEESSAREGLFGEDALAERMDGGDRRTVDGARGGGQAEARAVVDRPGAVAGDWLCRLSRQADALDETLNAAAQ